MTYSYSDIHFVIGIVTICDYADNASLVNWRLPWRPLLPPKWQEPREAHDPGAFNLIIGIALMNAISSSPNTSRTFKQSLKQGQQAHQIHLFWPFCNPGFALGFYHVLSQFLGTNILHQIAKMPPLVGFLCDHVCISRLQHLHATSHANLGWGINWRGTCQASSYMYVCIYIYIYMCVFLCMYICICICICTCICIYIYMCVCVYQ